MQEEGSMKTASLFLCGLLAISIAHTAAAQTRFSAKQQCAKPDPNYVVPVGDHEGHVLVLAVQQCTWLEGEVGGERLKSETSVVTSDIHGTQSHDRGYIAGSVANGDKYFVRFEGTGTMKDKMPHDGRCTWSFTGGTGKLAGISGKGTCKGTFAQDGTASFEIEGAYTLPGAK
jgi:hypothetical protein